MKRIKSVALATWMLEHLTFGPAKEALSGDLLEELQLGRSAGWYWRQVLTAIATGTCGAARDYALPLVFSAGWGMLYPAWRLIGMDLMSRAMPNGWGALAWPKSALMEIGYGVVPAVTFVWLGVLVYLLIRVDVLGELSPVRLLWGLSVSLTSLLVATMSLLHHLKHPRIDLISVTREDFYSVFHVFNISVPLTLSVLAALLCTVPHTPRFGRRQRFSSRQIVGRIARLIQAICLTLTLSPFSAAQIHANTAAGHRLEVLLEEFDGSNWAGYPELLQKSFVSQPDHAFLDRRFRELTGGFDLRKIEEESPTKVTALLQERGSDQFAHIVWQPPFEV